MGSLLEKLRGCDAHHASQACSILFIEREEDCQGEARSAPRQGCTDRRSGQEVKPSAPELAVGEHSRTIVPACEEQRGEPLGALQPSLALPRLNLILLRREDQTGGIGSNDDPVSVVHGSSPRLPGRCPAFRRLHHALVPVGPRRLARLRQGDPGQRLSEEPEPTLAFAAQGAGEQKRDVGGAHGSAPLQRRGAVRAADVAFLLSGALGREGERRLGLLAQALAGISLPETGEASRADRHEGVVESPEGRTAAGEAGGAAVNDRNWVVIGADAARLILAAQQDEVQAGESQAWLERAQRLASLLLTGRYDGARVFADRELRRRGLDLLPAPPVGAPLPGGGPRLALAVLLPFDKQDRAGLTRIVCITPPELFEEASHEH